MRGRVLERQARRYGVLPGMRVSAGSAEDARLDRRCSSTGQAPDVELLKSAKAAGAKVAFSSGGATSFDEARLKARLQAIKDAGLGWKDFWVPGKPESATLGDPRRSPASDSW